MGTVIGGYQVPKDTTMVPVHYAMCMMDKYFKDPLEFKPERWMKSKDCPGAAAPADKIHPFVQLPFGHGPRMCIGKRFAETEVMILFMKMVQNFRIEWNSPKELGIIQNVIAKPDSPLV